MRGLAAVAAAVCAAAAFGCAARGELRGIGTSTDETASTAAADAGAAGAASGPHASPIPSDYRASWARVNAAPFVSLGHAGGRWEANVYAEGAGGELVRADHGAVPVGARFVEEHVERADGGAGPVFMMEKRPPGFDPEHGDWRYVAVGASGEVAADGAVASCAGCHGDAPGDHLFRAVSAGTN